MKRATAVCIVSLLVGVTTPLAGQVGHEPDRSPYSDLRTNHTFSAYVGTFRGTGGLLDLAPSDGPVIGVRYDLRVGTPTEVSLNIAQAELSRFIVDPTLPLNLRKSGPFDTRITMIDGAVNLNVTGKKTWHGLAPYAGGFLGLAFGGTLAADPSGFEFNTKFYAGPQLGLRWYLGSHFMIRLEARDVLWRVTYPSNFRLPGPNGEDPVLAETEPDAEWTHQPQFIVGIGYSFRY